MNDAAMDPDSALMATSSLEEAGGELQALHERCRGVQLVYNGWNKEVMGIAIKNPRTWAWEITRLEGDAQRTFRQTGIDPLVGAVASELRCGIDPASGLGAVLDVVQEILHP